MGAFSQIIANLGPVRLAVMGAAVAGLVAFFIFLTSQLAGTNMELLYANLDQADAGQIVAQLESDNISFEVSQNGSRILVPSSDVGKIRLLLASQGLPGGGSIGYEIFDDASALGTTNFIQNINLVRALEGELARTIRSLKDVNAARVHLVLAQRQLFSREKQEPTASVILKLRGAGRLAREKIQAIQHLVAAAIPQLDPARISIVDDKGNLLARGTGDENQGAAAANLEEQRIALENRLARTIERLLEKPVGFGKVRAEVSADIDFSRLSTTEETFDPDGQVVRSTQTIEETSQSEESDGQQAVTVAGNLPDNAGAAGALNAKERDSRTEETVNFEISKKIINHVREFGEIRRLSVAVLVDGITEIGPDGETIYKERGQKEMENLAKLVSRAIGANPERGDQVEVINMRFVEIKQEVEVPLELFFGLGKNDLLRIAEVIVLSILAILVILLVVRPLVSRAFEAIPAAAAAAEQRLLAEAAVAPALAGPPEGAPPVEEEFEELIDIDRVEGRVRASSVKKVGEIVEKHPEEALSIVRSWLYQEGT